MIVDDNATNRRILEEILHNWGMQVISVESGAKALDALHHLQESGQTVSLVLTDYHMPNMDGFMLAERIREIAAFAETPIIVLTSGGYATDTKLCSELRIAAQLLKPVKQSELLNAITVVVAGDEQPALPVSAGSENEMQSLRPLQILLAEDGIANQKLAVGLLESWGHHVTVANDGQEAVDLWSGQSFDLILMDVQMPNLDGLDATRIIRQKEESTGAHIPIVALTAHALKGDREKCLEVGMDRYISKPVRRHELYRAIKTFFVSPGEESAADPTGQVKAAEIAWSTALEAVEGNVEVLKDVGQAAIDELPRLVTSLQEALRDSNAELLARLAHTIKGSVRLFGGERVEQLAAEIEQMGKQSALNEAKPLVEQLEEAVIAFCAALADWIRSEGQ